MLPDWTYEGETITEMPPEVTYMVYLITYSDDTMYIGSKVVRSERRLKPTKAQLAIRKNYKRVEIKESDWKTYIGSSKLTENKTIVSREILYLCITKRAATMLELREILCTDAIISEEYLNENAVGKYFRNSYEEIYKG